MAGQRRTRAQKEHATAQRSAQLSYSYSSSSNTSSYKSSGKSQVASRENPSKDAIADLFPYDVRLIYQDLRKTVIITVAVLAVLVGVKFGLR